MNDARAFGVCIYAELGLRVPRGSVPPFPPSTGLETYGTPQVWRPKVRC